MKKLNKALALFLSMLFILPLLPTAGTAVKVDAATGLELGTVVYYEDFNYANNSSKASVLSTLGWSVSEDLNANKTNYSFVDGRLLCDSLSTGATADSYVTVLDDADMGEIIKNDYSISYKITYVEAANYTRYGAFVYNYNGYKSYNSVHLRIAGYGNNQVRTATNWKDYEADGSYYMKSTGTSSISYKLFGVKCLEANASSNTAYPFVGKELTVRIAIDADVGPTVYVNGTKISVPTATYKELFLSTAQYAAAIALKNSKEVKFYIDDFMVYTGLGEVPTGVTKDKVTYVSPIEKADPNAIKVLSFNTLFENQSTDVFGNGITRTYHMSNVVSGLRPDIIGTQERNATNKSGVTALLQSDGGYGLANEYRTDTSVANVVSYVPILYNKSRFSLVANDATNNNNAHGALLFDKSYNIKDMTAAQIAAYAGTKGLAWAVLKDKNTGGYVLVLNAHFALNASNYTGYSDEEAREARLSNAAQAYEKMEEIYAIYGVIPTVFTGDFNMRAYDPAYKLLTEYFESSIYGSTDFVKYEYSMNKVTGYDFTRAPNAPIDHIFYTDQSLVPTRYYVGNKAPELMIASDHLPVMATFSYKKVAAPTPSHHTNIYSGTQYVTLTGKGLIYYTTDGTDPRNSATRKLYGEAISVNGDTIIKSCCKVDGVYSDINRVTLFFSAPIYITEAIKNSAGSDHLEGIEIHNASNVEVDLSDFVLWSYSNATESTCLKVADTSVTSQMYMAKHDGEYVLPAGETGFCPIVFSDSYLIKDKISDTESAYLVTVNEDATKVTYHLDRFAAAAAYTGMGNISADRIFPIDRTARSIGYTDSGVLVKRHDYYNATDGAVNNISSSFNMGNSNYTKLYITIATEDEVSKAFCVCNLDSTDGGITSTTDSAGTVTTTAKEGAFNFTPSDGKLMTTQSFTENSYTLGALTTEQVSAFNALEAERAMENGVAIRSEADFAAMSADGTYYLANDISISATYSAPFTGSINGMGHTITASAPLFEEMNGCVKNLTVAGNIAVTEGYNSAISKLVTGNARFEDVIINATLSGGTSTGGLVGYGKTGNSIIAIRCINNGNHSGTSQVGGLIGYSQGNNLYMDECINYGKITSTSYSGGLICRFGKDAATMSYRCNITNCINYGEVSSTKTRAAGIISYTVGNITISGCINYGYIHAEGSPADFNAGGIYGQGGSTYESGSSTVNTKNSLAISDCYNYGNVEGTFSAGGIVGKTSGVAPASGYIYSIERCGNEGNISVTDGGATSPTRGAGGIVGYFYGTTNHRISACYNVGNISAVSNSTADPMKVCGIAAYFNGTKVYFENCYNAGKITANGTAVAYQLYYNNHATGGDKTYIKNNYGLAVSGAVYEKNGTQASSCTTFTSAQLADGSLKTNINKGAGETVYFQQVGTEDHPVLREHDGFKLWDIVLKDKADYKETESFIYRVMPHTAAKDFEDRFLSKVRVFDGDTELNLNASLKTGQKVCSFDRGVEMDVAVIGDMDGDGAVTSTDYAVILKYIGGRNSLPELQKVAGDIDDSGHISTVDLLCVRKQLKG